MDNLKTNDDLIKELLTPEEQTELYNEVDQEVKKIHGGFREGSGRKKKNPDNVLQFQMRVSKKEKSFLQYARSHNIDYDELMEG
ncbi:MAG: hypothetical protein E7Z93_00565 [Cyanobacteria bacterium SIG32]|nr:hypothetical protein [Cyanobacteria bacterium SIG32]